MATLEGHQDCRRRDASFFPEESAGELHLGGESLEITGRGENGNTTKEKGPHHLRDQCARLISLVVHDLQLVAVERERDVCVCVYIPVCIDDH